jgi:hypothetical protein
MKSLRTAEPEQRCSAGFGVAHSSPDILRRLHLDVEGKLFALVGGKV